MSRRGPGVDGSLAAAADADAAARWRAKVSADNTRAGFLTGVFASVPVGAGAKTTGVNIIGMR